MSSFPVTSTYAALFAVLYVAANLLVAYTRLSTGQFFGVDRDTALERRVRGAGTIGEYGTVGIVLLALMEAQQSCGQAALSRWGLIFFLGRVAHGVQLSFPQRVHIIFRIVSFYGTLGLFLFAAYKLYFFEFVTKA